MLKRTRLALGTLLFSLPLSHALAQFDPPPTLHHLVRSSDRIVRGRVRWLETVVETVPANQRGDQAELVFTYLSLLPTEHLEGEPTPEIVVRVLGGNLGDSAVIYQDMPRFAADEEVLLFLRTAMRPRPSTGGVAHYLPYHRYGKFSVRQDGDQLGTTSRGSFQEV